MTTHLADPTLFIPPAVEVTDIVQFSENDVTWQSAIVQAVGEGGRISILLPGGARKFYDGICHVDDPLLQDPRMGEGVRQDCGGVWREGPSLRARQLLLNRIDQLEARIETLEGSKKRADKSNS